METHRQTTVTSRLQVSASLSLDLRTPEIDDLRRFTTVGTFPIQVKFIQPSSKLLPIDLKCSKVTIVEATNTETCFPDQQFHLSSPNALNNLTEGSSSVLQLFYNLPHPLAPSVVTSCPSADLLYSFYLLHIDPSQWKYPRSQRYPSLMHSNYHETFLSNYCSHFEPNFNLLIEARALLPGCYLAIVTVSRTSSPADFRQFIQPIEIIRSDLITTFGGNYTVKKDDDTLSLDFYASTSDPEGQESDQRKLNFTLLCYPTHTQDKIFLPNTPPLGPSRPTETNPQNANPWSIQWSNLNLIYRRPEVNLQFYEHRCFSSSKSEKPDIRFDPNTKVLNISDTDLVFNSTQLDFFLIVRHLIDGRQMITRLEVERELTFDRFALNWNSFEDVVDNLENLVAANPRKAVEFVTGLAEKMNAISESNVTLSLSISVKISAQSFFRRPRPSMMCHSTKRTHEWPM